MAGEFLLGALGGLTADPTDTYWALGSQALAQASPALFQRGDSGGRTFGTALGLGLLQSLLQFQAKRQANEDTIEASKLATPLFSMTNPAERAGYLTRLEEQGVGTNVLGKVSGLASALTQQEQMLKLMQAQRRAELAVELPADLLKAQVSSGGFSSRQLSEAIKELNKGTGAEAAFQKAVEPTPTPQIIDVGALKADLISESIPEKVTPDDQLDIRGQALKLVGPAPTVEKILPDDAINLSQREYNQKLQRISTQQKALDDWKSSLTNTESSLQHKMTTIKSIGDDLVKNPIVRKANIVQESFNQMKELANLRDQNKEQLRAAIDQFITLSAKVTDEESVVTLGEFLKKEDIQSLKDKIAQQTKNIWNSSSRLNEKAVNETLKSVEVIVNTLNKAKQKQIIDAQIRAKGLGLGDITEAQLGMGAPISTATPRPPVNPETAAQWLNQAGITGWKKK